MRWYVINLLIAFDQFCCAVFGGWCDESISSYVWRLDNKRKPAGLILRPAIDYIALKVFGQTAHCMKAYQEERTRAQFPPELR